MFEFVALFAVWGALEWFLLSAACDRRCSVVVCLCEIFRVRVYRGGHVHVFSRACVRMWCSWVGCLIGRARSHALVCFVFVPL